MQSLQKLRRYESLLIFLATTIYVVRRLFQEASGFDRMVTNAQQSRVPNYLIWRSLDNYNHVYNTIFPTIAGAIFLLAAWYIFHYYFYPRIQATVTKEKTIDSSLFFFLALTIIFSLASVFLFDFFKLYIRYKHDTAEHIIGLKVFSLFRKLYLVTDTVAVLIVIFMYELLAQFYYFIRNKLREEKEENFQYLDYFLITTITLFIIFIALAGHIPREGYWYGSLRELSIITVGCITIYFAQEQFYKKVLPYFSSFQSKEFINGIVKFTIITLIGSFISYLLQYTFWITYVFVNFGFHFEWIFIVFVFIVFPSICIAFIRKVLTKEKTQLRTAVSQKVAELSSLRSQINPHFLFNALNTLYAVSLKENADKTADGIQKLGDMMRFMLNENNQDRIPLKKEIEYLQNYIEIQQMRIAESPNIDIKVNIQNSERDVFIAPMLLNPFIENAFKHGISFRNPSWIFITLTFDETKLYFKVHNSLHTKTENELEHDNNGIGLDNVKKRLELIYKNRYALDIQQSEQDFFVSLTITYW